MKNRIKSILPFMLALSIACQPFGTLAATNSTINYVNAAAKKTKKIMLRATPIAIGASLAAIVGTFIYLFKCDGDYKTFSTISDFCVEALVYSPIVSSATILAADLVDIATDTSTTKQSIINKMAQCIKRASPIIVPAIAMKLGFLRFTRWDTIIDKACAFICFASPAILIGEIIDEYTYKEASDNADTTVPA